MFQWNFEHSRDRKKLFVLLFLLFSIGAVFIWCVSGIFSQEVTSEEATSTVVEKVTEHGTPEKRGERSVEGGSFSERSDPTDEREKEKAKEVVHSFAKAFYSYDASDSVGHIENSKEYMTDAMYAREKRKQEQSRASLQRIKAEVSDIIVMESARGAGIDEITWAVLVRGEVMNADGETNKDETLYHIALSQDEERGWLVSEVRINEST